MKTGIIIPCYNEADRLDQNAFVEFINTHEDYHLCFVNDGSKDMTVDVLQAMKAAATNDVSIVDCRKNRGKAAAVRAGVRYLYTKSEIGQIGFMDADLSTDFKDFKDLVKTLNTDENLYMVFGSRNSGGGGIKRDVFRNFMSRFVKQFILLILGMPIRDTQCGAKVFMRNVVPIIYADAFMSKWLFDVEIFLRLKRHLGKTNVMQHIQEQPLMRWVHVDDSKLGLKDSLEIPFRLAQIWVNYTMTSQLTLLSEEAMTPPVYELNDTSTIVLAA